MKPYFTVSLCRNGILGGAIVIDEEFMTYKTGKLTIPDRFRNLVMRYDEITGITTGGVPGFPTVTIFMDNGEAFKFIVFSKNRFLRVLEEHGINVTDL